MKVNYNNYTSIMDSLRMFDMNIKDFRDRLYHSEGQISKLELETYLSTLKSDMKILEHSIDNYER